jgi:UDP:flavonoid glycosyltransferase YjiC (YdhE family)
LIHYWPGLDVIHAADFVIGSGGYNTVSECSALNIPFLSLPHGRIYDRQDRRVQQAGFAKFSGLESVKSLLQQASIRSGESVYENGARKACQLILSA